MVAGIDTGNLRGRLAVSPRASSLVPMDPRTKILLVVVANVCVMTVVKTPVTVTALVVSLVVFVMSRSWKILGAIIGVFLAFLAFRFLGAWLGSWYGTLMVITGEYGSRITISLSFAVWLFLTTTPAAFVAALKRSRVPRAIIIPLAVMFRFFPAVVEEMRAIWDAMKLRGMFRSGASMVAHPMRLVEFIIVPLIGSTLQISEDLSASAMIRGLGSPGRSTSVVPVGFGPGDIVGWLGIIAIIGAFVWVHVGV